ncbi:MAG: T9SS type A sorting domain-containing protein [Bacteroidia bacterium]|nr:T9SS type A sorting domain-containing protein [Bacteroidia bacterium]
MKILNTIKLGGLILCLILGSAFLNPANSQNLIVGFGCAEVESNGDLTFDIGLSTVQINCNAPSPINCLFRFEGNFLIKDQFNQTLVTQPMQILYTIQNGTNGGSQIYNITIPASSLGSLNQGSVYSLYIELVDGFLPSPFVGSNGHSYDVFDGCWAGYFDDQNVEVYSDSYGPCESLATMFTYNHPADPFEFDQDFSFICSMFGCTINYFLSGELIAPDLGPSIPNNAYTWYLGGPDGTFIGQGRILQYSFPNCAKYDVTLKIRNSSSPEICTEYTKRVDVSNSSQCTFIPCCGTARMMEFRKDEIPLWLNPNRLSQTDKLLVKYYMVDAGYANLSIIDLSGREILNEEVLSEKAGDQVAKLTLPKLSRGMYMLRISDGKTSGMTKFIIE